jgi:2,3-dihydroxybiphenyl 1,2-dioxygenase
MAKITELGYIGLSVTDRAAWLDYARDIVGMEVVDDGEPDRCYLRMDGWHHRIVLHDDSEDDLAYIGWRVAGPVEFKEMARDLEAAGVVLKIAGAAEAAERRVLGLMRMESPGGIPTEIFYGPQVDAWKPFHPGRPMFGRFLTGEQGFGHLVLNELDVEAAIEFYQRLGFVGAVEYQIPLPDGNVGALTFMHCNDRQHSIAFGLGPMQRRVNHLMIEYTELDDLGISHDRVQAAKIDVTLLLGKHANDAALTFYCANPSGWLWELGWGSKKAPAQQEYYTRDIFGHDNGAPGYGLDLPLK